MRRPCYLILHGYQGSGPGHWQTWLAGRLRSGDAAVHYPDLPDADHPQLRAWLDALDAELAAIGLSSTREAVGIAQDGALPNRKHLDLGSRV